MAGVEGQVDGQVADDTAAASPEAAASVPQAAQPLWEHQVRGIIRSSAAVKAGCRALAVVAPPGSGKTRYMAEIAARAAERNKKVLLLTNRKILLKQTADALKDRGVHHGVMAANYDPAFLNDIQLASIPTIDSRVFQRQRWDLPAADLVLVDEAHSNNRGAARKIIEHYKARGAVIIGPTATPVGLAGLYTGLVEIASNSELAAKGILVNGEVFAPSEPDMKGVAMIKGEFAPGQMAKRVMQCIVFGDVFKHFMKLNPSRKPTVLFAPGVKESAYFVEQFNARGIPSAHIDGATPDKQRTEIFEKMRAREIILVSSCGVLREGWDFPQVAHGILVQCCGGLSNYLQIVGRLKRSAPGKTSYTLQDHSGAWWRHGSPDEDRIWSLDDTDASLAKKKKKNQQAGEEKQPIRCPECGGVRSSGAECPWCGHKHKMSVRMVRTVQGDLVRVMGNAVKVNRKDTEFDSDEKAWKSCLFKAARAKKSMTFNQALTLFKRLRFRDPPEGLRNMPEKGSLDWDRRVADVYPQYRNRTDGTPKQGETDQGDSHSVGSADPGP